MIMWEVPGLWASPAHNPWSPEGQPGIPGTPTLEWYKCLYHLYQVQVFDQVFTVAHKGQDAGLAAVSKEERQPVPPAQRGMEKG